MQISVENTSDIGRKMTIQLPEEKIQTEIDARLKSLTQQVRLDGFRPGKVPARIIRQRFGKQVRQEVLSDLIGSSLSEAIKEQALHLASEPQITPKEMDQGKGLSFEAVFEIYPQINLTPVEDLEFTKPVSAISEADLESMIERLREQKKTWQEVDRPAQSGDRVTITFEGLLGDQAIGEGKTEHFEIEIGSDKMIPGFEDQLLNSRRNDHLEFELTFPDEYHDAKLAGQTVHFKVDVEKVEEGNLPEITAEFIKDYGVESGDEEDFRREVKTNMERHLKTALKEEIKTRALDALYQRHPIPVPEGLVKKEIQRLLAPLGDTVKQNPEILNRLPLDNIRENAKKRVALGLLLAEIIKVKELKPDPQEVRQVVTELAHNYEDPQEVVKWYYANPEQLAQIESQVIEDRAVEWILEHAKVTEEPLPYEDLVKKQHHQAA